MSPLAAPPRPTSSASNRSSGGPHSGSAQPQQQQKQLHTSPSPSTPAGHHSFAALNPNKTPMASAQRSAGGPRQSLDAARILGGAGPLSPRMGGMRPNSEMLGLGGQGGFGNTAEAEAIDKWFEDLQSYEATLEEMAAASLDANFKEELSAIEQWFRVLSEAERTAALYSLLQSSTQVQIRFFITVLQQMARSDPMNALLSPAAGGSMEQQMEAKLAQLSTKSPASPVVRQFARQSLGAEVYLSPNATGLSSENSGGSDAAALLASQRAKLKANAANRVSAPGQLFGDSGLKSPKWPSGGGGGTPGTVAEEGERHSRSPSPRPKSTGSDLQPSSSSAAASQAAFARAAAQVAGLENQLSPILGGSWASQVGTPMVPMFASGQDDHGKDGTAQGLGEAANKLAQWGAAHQAGGAAEGSPSGIQLDDARKFRRQSKGLGAVGGGFSGVLSGMGAQSQSNGRQPTAPTGQAPSASGGSPMLQPPRSGVPTQLSGGAGVGLGASSPLATSQAMLGAQQAAAMAAQQNWRNGLGSPSIGAGGMPSPGDVGANLAMMNMMNQMSGMNMNDPNSAAAIQNMANLLTMQQQMQQVQQLQALQQQMQQGGMLGVNAMAGGNPMLSPVSARLGMGFPQGFPMMNAANLAAMAGGGLGQKRSPVGGRLPVPGKPAHTPGSGSNPDEELDMRLLSDIPSWLRGLRLHKYTPNFEGCTWQEMVLMDEADLEARGVAAVGARRKMLRTFETVRLKKAMALPGDGEPKAAEDEKQETTSTSPTNGGSDA